MYAFPAQFTCKALSSSYNYNNFYFLVSCTSTYFIFYIILSACKSEKKNTYNHLYNITILRSRGDYSNACVSIRFVFFCTDFTARVQQ